MILLKDYSMEFFIVPIAMQSREFSALCAPACGRQASRPIQNKVYL